MTDPNQRNAAEALTLARPIIDGLDPSRDSEELAADIIDAWAATETAMRAMMGGSSLSGQALIGALRQRNLLTIDQAHALMDFLAARNRSGEVSYRPTATDLAAARDGYRKLVGEMGGPAPGVPSLNHTTAFRVQTPAMGTSSVYPPGGTYAPQTPPPAAAPAPVTEPVRHGQPWGLLTAIAIGVLALGGIAYFGVRSFRGGASDGDLSRGVQLYREGKLEAARAEFEAASRRSPQAARPHLWLARVARDQARQPAGGVDAEAVERASRELTTAGQLEPRNGEVQREAGSFLLWRGRADLARARYIKAIELNPADTAAMGWLGCALTRMGQPQQAQVWYQRAGQGDWSRCAAAPPGAAPPPA